MFRIQYALGAVLLAGAVGVMAPQANAEQTYRGTFHLPFQTYWGGSVLSPGDYTVSIEGGAQGVTALHVQGDKGAASILIGPVELRDRTGKGRLVLSNVGGVYAIREFDAGAIGKAFTFRVPKTIQGVTAAHGDGGNTTSEISVH